MEHRSADELAEVFARHGVATQGRMGAGVLGRGLIIELTEPAGAGTARYHAQLSDQTRALVGDGWGHDQRDAFLQAYANWLSPPPERDVPLPVPPRLERG